jgi:enamine deaminase RidA (YjgF/YER057c/UK114 family)
VTRFSYDHRMSITLHTIAGRSAPTGGFCHATAADGDRIVHISGQVGADAGEAIGIGDSRDRYHGTVVLGAAK